MEWSAELSTYDDQLATSYQLGQLRIAMENAEEEPGGEIIDERECRAAYDDIARAHGETLQSLVDVLEPVHSQEYIGNLLRTAWRQGYITNPAGEAVPVAYEVKLFTRQGVMATGGMSAKEHHSSPLAVNRYPRHTLVGEYKGMPEADKVGIFGGELAGQIIFMEDKEETNIPLGKVLMRSYADIRKGVLLGLEQEALREALAPYAKIFTEMGGIAITTQKYTLMGETAQGATAPIFNLTDSNMDCANFLAAAVDSTDKALGVLTPMFTEALTGWRSLRRVLALSPRVQNTTLDALGLRGRFAYIVENVVAMRTQVRQAVRDHRQLNFGAAFLRTLELEVAKDEPLRELTKWLKEETVPTSGPEVTT